MNTLHPVYEPEKAQTLAQSMEEHGWVGVPLVVWNVYGQLLTGTHRYEAASNILGWDDSEIPTIDIEDVYSEDGKDFESILEVHGNPGPFANTWDNLVDVLNELSSEIRMKYGIEAEH